MIKKRNPLSAVAATIAAVMMAIGVSVSLPVSAADDWSWANYGFSGTAIANPDPFEPTHYLIGGYVASVHYLHPISGSYVYHSNLILDTEGVAIRFRFHWVNSEPGYRAVADMTTGIAVYPMDESIDVAVVTAGGIERFRFPTPAAYDYMTANEFRIMDNGETLFVEVCGKTVAILKFDGVQTMGGIPYIQRLTITDGNGYVYGRLNDTRVLAEECHMGYSSQQDRALILVQSHTLKDADFDASLPEEKETDENWVPETEVIETESDTETDSITETQLETESETESARESASESETATETSAVIESETEAITEPGKDTEATTELASETDEQSTQEIVTTEPTTSDSETPADSLTGTETPNDPTSGCGSLVGGFGVLLGAAATALWLGKKKA